MRSEILLIVHRLKAGDCFELFVFALQLVCLISIRQCKETVYCWVKVVPSSTCWNCPEEVSSDEELGPLGEGGQGWGCENTWKFIKFFLELKTFSVCGAILV